MSEKGEIIMRSAGTTFKRIFIFVFLIGVFVMTSAFVQEAAAFEKYSNKSIKGTYAFVGTEQGGGDSLGNSVPSEAAMGTATFDGAGNIQGFITWNMPHPGKPYPARLILSKYPFTGTYFIDSTGFGRATFKTDLSSMGIGTLKLKFDLLVTKATKEKVAVEFHSIGKELLSTGALPIFKMQKREE
jgi:hypothetical protein